MSIFEIIITALVFVAVAAIIIWVYYYIVSAERSAIADGVPFIGRRKMYFYKVIANPVTKKHDLYIGSSYDEIKSSFTTKGCCPTPVAEGEIDRVIFIKN